MAFAATVEWDVRTTGNDANGGGFDSTSGTPGTNYSIQDSPQITYTDLIIDGTTNTKCTSSGNPFTSAHVGNIINITSGTGFTVQRVQVMSVTAAVATCDKSLGTLSSTGGNGKLGGSFATIAAANTLLVAGQTIHIKAGTYTHTSAIAVPVATVTFRGFGTTHNDGGTKPLITTATNSVNIFTTSSNSGLQVWENLSISSTASTRGNGILQLSTHGTAQFWVIRNCLLDGFNIGLNSDNAGADFDVNNIMVQGTEIKNCITSGIVSNTGSVWFHGCWLHNNGAGTGNYGIQVFSAVYLYIDRTIISAGAGTGVICGNQVYITNSTIANNAQYGLWPANPPNYVVVRNCILYGNAVENFHFSGTWTNLAFGLAVSGYNATNNTSSWGTSKGDVLLSANPFTSSTDFSLNNTAGGGAACKSMGFQWGA